MTVDWRSLGLPVPKRVRDLWHDADVPAAADYTVQVPRHGAVLLRAS